GKLRHPVLLTSHPPLIGGVLAQVVYAPDGKTIATAGYQEPPTLWDVADPRRMSLRSAVGSGDPYRVTFSPDGRTLAVSSDEHNRTAALWNISDLSRPREYSTLDRHTDLVYGVAFSPDGSKVLTTSGDQTAILWDVSNRRNPIFLDTL